MDQDETWYRSGSRPRRRCVRWGRSSHTEGDTAAIPRFSAHVCCGQTAESQLLLNSCWDVGLKNLWSPVQPNSLNVNTLKYGPGKLYTDRSSPVCVGSSVHFHVSSYMSQFNNHLRFTKNHAAFLNHEQFFFQNPRWNVITKLLWNIKLHTWAYLASRL